MFSECRRRSKTKCLFFRGLPIFSQPSHVLYGGAHLFSAGLCEKLNHRLKSSLDSFTDFIKKPNTLLADFLSSHDISSDDLSKCLQLNSKVSLLEDYRIDFEDGLGTRSTEKFQRILLESKLQLVSAIADPGTLASLPTRLGIRTLSFEDSSRTQSANLLTSFFFELDLDLFFESKRSFFITLPKVSKVSQLTDFLNVVKKLEKRLGNNKFGLEILIEDAKLFSDDMEAFLKIISEVLVCRKIGFHIGIFDYLSTLKILGSDVGSRHPLVDDLRVTLLKWRARLSDLELSDGVLQSIPSFIERSIDPSLTVQRVWVNNITEIMRTLDFGFYQGWDIHPQQVVCRLVANAIWTQKRLPAFIERGKKFVQSAGQATKSGASFDDRASVLMVVEFFERALYLGFTDLDELKRQGCDLDQLRKILT